MNRRPEHIASGHIQVVGGGVVGLTCALQLARAGRRATVFYESLTETTSAVAGAIWFPYAVAPVSDALAYAHAGLVEFTALAEHDPADVGVLMAEGVHYDRAPHPDTRWTAMVPGAIPVSPPPSSSFTSAIRARLPVIDMSVYLKWMHQQCVGAGVKFRQQRITALEQLPPGPVVLAAGLASGALVGDDTGYPLRGQVVRVDKASSGITEWIADDDNPAGPLYVIPRVHDVVIGGTADRGSTDLTVDANTERRILERAAQLVPAVRGARVVSRGVGLRPARPSLRVENAVIGGRYIVCCYGFGGAGVTLSWGAAERVCALIGAG